MTVLKGLEIVEAYPTVASIYKDYEEHVEYRLS